MANERPGYIRETIKIPGATDNAKTRRALERAMEFAPPTRKMLKHWARNK